MKEDLFVDTNVNKQTPGFMEQTVPGLSLTSAFLFFTPTWH